MAFFVDMRADPLRSLAFGGISSTYAAIGGPFLHPMRSITFKNYTNAQITFSFDGINDHVTLIMLGAEVLDVTSWEFQGNGLLISNMTQMYAKQTSSAPTSGSVYIECTYARGM
jgi:hypothetical protein